MEERLRKVEQRLVKVETKQDSLIEWSKDHEEKDDFRFHDVTKHLEKIMETQTGMKVEQAKLIVKVTGIITSVTILASIFGGPAWEAIKPMIGIG